MNSKSSKTFLRYVVIFFLLGTLWTINMYYRHIPEGPLAILGWIASGGLFLLAIIALVFYIIAKY